MAVTQPSATPTAAGVTAPPAASGADNAPGARQGTVLLAALVAACLYAAFAHGATDFPSESYLQVLLAALALGAAALCAGERGIAFRPRGLAPWGLALLVAFGVWTGLTLLWSVAPDRTWIETNRALAYALVVALGIAVGSSAPRALERVALGWLGVSVAVALYALAGKTFPGLNVPGLFDLNETTPSARLRAPLEYWNALALVCALGVPIAVRVASDTVRRPGVRLGGLAAVFLLLSVTGMTYSRGGVIALVAATLVTTALGPARLRGLAVLALAGAATSSVLGVAYGLPGLKVNGAPLAARSSAGGVLALDAGVCLIALLVVGYWLIRYEPAVRWSPARSRQVWRGLACAGAAAVLIAVLALAASSRGVSGRISDKVDGFTKTTQDKQFDPNRLASTNSGNRWVWWKEAVGAWSDRPVGGWGAGSFAVTHLRYRENTLSVEQPHSVPLQFLAETGLIGGLLALGALGVLLWVGLQRVRHMGPSRERGFGVALLAGAVAWTAHGFYDWDWDIPGVTIPALLFLGVLSGGGPARGGLRLPRRAVVFVDPERESRALGGRTIAVVAATLLLSAFVASAVLPALSDGKASDAEALADGAGPATLERAAARAELAARLDPLAVRPLFVGSSIALARGRVVDSRRLLLEAVKRQPDDVKAWTQLASTAALLADRVGFERAALRALLLDPHNPRLKRTALSAVAFATPAGNSATATGTPLAPAPAPAPAPASSVAPSPAPSPAPTPGGAQPAPEAIPPVTPLGPTG